MQEQTPEEVAEDRRIAIKSGALPANFYDEPNDEEDSNKDDSDPESNDPDDANEPNDPAAASSED